MLKVADRTNNIELSASLKISGKAINLKSQGIDVIALSAGEPDANMPEELKKEAIKALENGLTKYTKVDGIAPLKEEICGKLKKDNNLDYKPEEIIVGAGAKQVVFNAILAFVGEGDEVIIPSPYWVSYPEMVKFAQGKCVFVEGKEEADYKITPDQLKAAITDKTKAIFLNSPSNPTGSVYTKEELTSLGEVLKGKDILIISDEIYEEIVFEPNEHHSIAALCPFLKDNTLVINGLSKAYSMTGLRIGYGAAPSYVINALKKIQSHSTSNANSVTQYASVPAFKNCRDYISNLKGEFQSRRDTIFNQISKIPGFKVRKPQGAFYFFPDISYYLDRGIFKNDIEFCDFLLEKAHVAVVPGTAFGAPQNIRMSYALELERFLEALKRIEKALKEVT